MQLKNDAESREILKSTIFSYFHETGRSASNFLDSEDEDFFYAHFLIATRHVIRYSLGMDRRIWLGGVSFAIGPHYFSLRSLLSAKESEKLMIEASTAAIRNNLLVLDAFWERIKTKDI